MLSLMNLQVFAVVTSSYYYVDFSIDNKQNLRMNLIGNNSNKNSLPQKNIKEKFLNDEIENLRAIYQESTSFHEKMNSMLKKAIQFNAQAASTSQIAAINSFIDDMADLEQTLLDLANLSQMDNENFSATVLFKTYNKNNEAVAFKKIMKSHEDFKQSLNRIILRLQKDIQKLQTNGYHIYDALIKPNYVLNNIKKNTIDNYLSNLSQMHLIFDKMKNEMSSRSQARAEKQPLHIFFQNNNQKCKDFYYKVLEEIWLKQKLEHVMMVEEINNVKLRLKTYNRKQKDLEESICTSKNHNKIQVTAVKLLLNKYQDFKEKQLKEYWNCLKDKTDKTMVPTSHLYHLTKKTSKSCHSILQTARCNDAVKIRNQRDSGSYQSSSHIMGSDILESVRLN